MCWGVLLLNVGLSTTITFHVVLFRSGELVIRLGVLVAFYVYETEEEAGVCPSIGSNFQVEIHVVVRCIIRPSKKRKRATHDNDFNLKIDNLQALLR